MTLKSTSNEPTRDPFCAACATRMGLAAFLFMWRRPLFSAPPIASGRFTRGRLAAYWLDGFVLVPPTLGGVRIPDNVGWTALEVKLPEERCAEGHEDRYTRRYHDALKHIWREVQRVRRRRRAQRKQRRGYP